MNIAITGKNSFIGTYFINKFKDQFQISEIDLIGKRIGEVSFTDFDVVFHVAAIVHSTKKIQYEQYYKINTELAFKTAKYAKKNGVKQFILMSTAKVYGEGSNSIIYNEYSKCEPQDNYSKSKLEAEKLISTLEDDNFNVAIIRTPVVIGPGVKGNIQSLIKLVDRFPLIPLGYIKNKRTFASIEHLVRLIHKIIITSDSGLFLAGDVTLSTSELIILIKKYLKNKALIVPFPFKKLLKFIKPDYYDRLLGSFELNNKLTIEKTGIKNENLFDESLKKTITLYLKK